MRPRVTEGESKRVNTILPLPLVRRIDEWRRQQPDLPNVSEAMRRLIEIALDSGKPKRVRT
jgi:hypothetical protein